MIITDENHPYGCEYEPAEVTIRCRQGEAIRVVPMRGERCKWCGEEFVSAKALKEIESKFSQDLSTNL